jgi:hypothetical protein
VTFSQTTFELGMNFLPASNVSNLCRGVMSQERSSYPLRSALCVKGETQNTNRAETTITYRRMFKIKVYFYVQFQGKVLHFVRLSRPLNHTGL